MTPAAAEETKRRTPGDAFITETHAGHCVADCWRFNPANLSYAVVLDGAVIKHHTGPHAKESARTQAADWKGWHPARRVHVEEFEYVPAFERGERGNSFRRTATPIHVVNAPVSP